MSPTEWAVLIPAVTALGLALAHAVAMDPRRGLSPLLPPVGQTSSEDDPAD